MCVSTVWSSAGIWRQLRSLAELYALAGVLSLVPMASPDAAAFACGCDAAVRRRRAIRFAAEQTCGEL